VSDPYASIAVLERSDDDRAPAKKPAADPYAAIAAVDEANDAVPPTYDSSTTELVRGDQLPETTATTVADYTDEQRAAIAAVARSGTADQVKTLLTSFGRSFTGSDEELGKILAFYKDPKNANTPINLPETDNTLKAVDPGDGVSGAVARGITSWVPFSNEIAAGIDTLTDPDSSLAENLDRNRGNKLFDEENHPIARGVGQFIGSIPIGGVEFAGARAAARTAGMAAVRSGKSVEEARQIASRVFAARSAAEGAAINGAYETGNADGSFGERIGAGAIGAVTGGIAGGTVGYAGSRIAQGLAARRSVAAVARSAADDMARRASVGTTESAQIAALADQQGIKLLPQDVASGPGIGRATAGAAQTPFGANTIRNATNDMYDSFRTRVGEVGGAPETVSDVGSAVKMSVSRSAGRAGEQAEATSRAVLDAAGNPVDYTGAGQLAQRGVNRWMVDTAERANQLYARVPIAPAAEANVSNTRAVLADLTQGMESNPELGGLFEAPRLQGYLRALTPEQDQVTGEVVREGRLSWRDLQEFRTRIGDMLDEPRLAEKIAPRQLRALYGALSQDMEATATAQGPNALRLWRRANGYYNGRMNRIRDTAAIVVGERTDRTPNEAMAAMEGLLRDGSTGDAASFSRLMRTIPAEDARTVRATIVNSARGGRQFDPAELARNWGKLSERGKSALLPQPGLRDIMEDAAGRAATATRDPFAGKSGEQVFLDFERMANNRGDSVNFRRQMSSLAPEEANAFRSLVIHRMGLANAGAQNADGDAFSIGKFLTRWNDMTPQARTVLFGNAEMRDDMTALARLAERVKGSEALRGHSNTGAININDKTTHGLAVAAIAALTGHPLVAAAAAAPVVYQRWSAQILTSPRLLRWLARAPKKPNIQAQRSHILALRSVARAEPAIAGDIFQLQARLASAYGTSLPTKIAAEERLDDRPEPEQQGQANSPSY
jgi:hypothetical protein